MYMIREPTGEPKADVQPPQGHCSLGSTPSSLKRRLFSGIKG